MIDYEKCDFRTLDRIFESGVRADDRGELDMKWWGRHHTCGTAGCLVGNYCMDHIDSTLMLRMGRYGCADLMVNGEEASIVELSKRLGIPRYAGAFLFTSHECHLITAPRIPFSYLRSAQDLTPPAALRRLRITLKYLKRKQLLLREHDWWMSLSKKERRESDQHFGNYDTNRIVKLEEVPS